jgi:hypothetical protein
MSEFDFFRRCWLTLKATASGKLRAQMDGIEVGLEGIAAEQKHKPKEVIRNDGKPKPQRL